jgi:hypothetical protein
MFTTNLRKWLVLVTVLTGMAAVGMVSALAASSVAAQFELTIDGRHEPVPVGADYPFGGRHTGRFTSKPPFCASGSLVDLQVVVSGGVPVSNRRLFTCDDGTGTLTLSIFNPIAEHDPPFRSTWTILEGSGSYAGLRGTGTYRGEFLSGSPGDFLSVVFRSTLDGFADRDSVAPAVAISSVRAIKLRRPAGAYSIRLALSLRDDVDGNAVSYTVTATGGRTELARAVGKATGSVSLAFRVRPATTKVRSLLLNVTAVDPVGNEVRMARTVKLPR